MSNDNDPERREREALAHLDASQQRLIKRARAMGLQITTKTLVKLLDEASRGMSPTELAHLYAAAIAGMCGAAMHYMPPDTVADILDATAMGIRQHPDKVRGTVQ